MIIVRRMKCLSKIADRLERGSIARVLRLERPTSIHILKFIRFITITAFCMNLNVFQEKIYINLICP